MNDLGRRTMHGAKLLMIQAALARSGSFLSQLILGYLLNPRDFGLYFTALSLTAMVTVFRDAGIGRLLVQRQEEYGRLARPMVDLALMLNSLAAIGIVLVGIGAAQAKQSPVLAWMMVVLAGSVVIRSPTAVYQARLMADLRFSELTRVELYGIPLRHGLMVLLALAGLGPMSFVLPMLVVAVYEVLILRRMAGPAPGSRLNWVVFREVFVSMRWIIVGAVGITLTIQGDILSITVLEPSEVVGLYGFGLTFAAAITQVFVGGLTGLLMPAMTKARDDPPRLRRAFCRAMGLMALSLSFVGILGAITAPALIELLWPPKWEPAIPAAVAALAVLMVRSVSPIGTVVCEVRGRWRLWALLLVIDAAGTMAFAAVGALVGGVLAISLMVALHRTVWGVVECLVGARLAYGTAGDVVRPLLRGAVIGIVAAAAGIGVTSLLGFPLGTLGGGATGGGVVLVVFAGMTLWLARVEVEELKGAFLRRGPKEAAPDAPAA